MPFLNLNDDFDDLTGNKQVGFRHTKNQHSKGKNHKIHGKREIRNIKQYTLDVLNELVECGVIPEEIGGNNFKKFEYIRVKTSHNGELMLDWHGKEGKGFSFKLDEIKSDTLNKVMTLMDVHYGQRLHMKTISEKRRGKKTNKRLTIPQKRLIGTSLLLSLESSIPSKIRELENFTKNIKLKLLDLILDYNNKIEELDSKGTNKKGLKKVNISKENDKKYIHKSIIYRLISARKKLTHYSKILCKIGSNYKKDEINERLNYVKYLIYEIEDLFQLDQIYTTRHSISGGELSKNHDDLILGNNELTDDEIIQFEIDKNLQLEDFIKHNYELEKYLESLGEEANSNSENHDEMNLLMMEEDKKKEVFKKYFYIIYSIIMQIYRLVYDKKYGLNKENTEEKDKNISKIKAIFGYGNYYNEFDINNMISVLNNYLMYAKNRCKNLDIMKPEEFDKEIERIISEQE